MTFKIGTNHEIHQTTSFFERTSGTDIDLKSSGGFSYLFIKFIALFGSENIKFVIQSRGYYLRYDSNSENHSSCKNYESTRTNIKNWKRLFGSSLWFIFDLYI